MFTRLPVLTLGIAAVFALGGCSQSDLVAEAVAEAEQESATVEAAESSTSVEAPQVAAATEAAKADVETLAVNTTDVAAALTEEQIRESLIKSIQLAEAPEGATSVATLRKAGYKPGQRVAIRGQIGGRNPPWYQGFGLLMVADATELKACTTGTCGAPWDFCSAPVAKLKEHTGVVRWVDEQGEPREIGFEEVAEIAPLSTVVVSGTVADIEGAEVLVIDADGFYLEDPGPFAEMMKSQKM